MTHAVTLTLQGVGFQLPDGRKLFDGLDERFDRRRAGLVGRNGAGKSVLAGILAGTLSPSSGRVLRSGSVFYLPQQIAPQAGQTVGALAGVQQVLDALRRIENGSTAASDFDRVGERWDLRERLAQTLAAFGLAGLPADLPASRLSGGEITRVGIAGALLSDADVLVLDEPSNHLDRDSRQALLDQLHRWPGGLIVVSHDRALLDGMQRIVELSETGLRSYGGGYRFYAEIRAQERTAAVQTLEHRRAEHRREQRQLDRQRERLARRQSRGARDAANANLAPILLGLRKSRSEHSAGRMRARQDAARAVSARRVYEAAAAVGEDREVVLLPPTAERAPIRIAELRNVVLPHVTGATRRIDLRLLRGQRLAVTGPNGSGKSTLLRLLAGQLAALDGQCEVGAARICIDQHLSVLDPASSVLDQLLAVNRTADEGRLRTQLALLGLDAGHVVSACACLSGGERVRAAIALALYAERPAQLLLLDEPSNHLDLAATQALEAALRQFDGTLVVASHDAHFLDALGLTHRLEAGPWGWRLSPVTPGATLDAVAGATQTP
jgi:ATPase subunit of ABC transporter with duplicated ATPase domains